jgi:hypothetical protein
VVDDYSVNYRERAGSDLRFYAQQSNLARVVELAALAKSKDGKRQPHQRRLSAATLRRAHAELDQCDLASCHSFDALFEMVEGAIGGIHGIGALTVYDTACRIGAYLKLEPGKVYLHAGARDGARAIGLQNDRGAFEIEEFPVAFRKLRACEIEDCLCIYKKDLRRIQLK